MYGLQSNVLQHRYFNAQEHTDVKSVEIITPAEDVGRDTVSRFDMQFQAAAYAALQILDGKEIDCVYCDYHDDFVVRSTSHGRATYHFFQVKTKSKLNHQWNLAQIFAIKSRGQKNDEDSLKNVKSSFAGKLLQHGIIFDEACTEVTLLSNVYFDDAVVTTVEELRGKTPTTKAAKFLSENFSAIFAFEPVSEGQSARDILSKLSLWPAASHIGRERNVFASAARTAIHQYSEIDLNYYETEELANGLVDLVSRKSRKLLEGIAPADIASEIGVGLDDLLEVLSISRSAYDTLRQGGDSNALKQASVIQRWLKKAGARDEMIEYASQQKVNWDIWLRNARHVYSPLDLAILLDAIDQIYARWAQSGSGFPFLNSLIEEAKENNSIAKFNGISRELLFGAVTSVAIRLFSR